MTKTRRPKRKRGADDDDPSDIIDKLTIDYDGDVPSYPPLKRLGVNRESAKFGESTESESAEWESAQWESTKWESAQWESAKFGESAKVREPTRFILPLRPTNQYKQDIKIEKEDLPMEDSPMKDSGSSTPGPATSTRSKTNSGSDAIMFTVEEAWNALRASNVADAHPRNVRYDLPTGEFLSYPVERSYNLGAMGRYVRKKRAPRWD
ncbi:hypothetical protein GMOD_00005705 [Pyrenophora seminiperda CCB06]|uniref:Uncharacterized protein n=1 Tax=Pyrenophora seminiperda CCB06 TaxID=1302712 RepID=A0A3M7M9K2_9PLEO|nr:hypothetical protein GMOD_00005705 [Pyrenophora seminiperda CCB06]